MIVVDTNVVAYLIIPGQRSAAARQVFRTDPEWRAPVLWRSELRNVLATRVRNNHLALSEATTLMSQAEALLEDREHLIASERLLEVAAGSDLSAYDAEFVVLSRVLDVPLVTTDEEILARVPDRTVRMEEFAD